MAAVLVLAGPAAIAQDLWAIGSWIVSTDQDPATGAARHVAFTPSSQGSGAIGLRCIGGEPSVVLALNGEGGGLAPGRTVTVAMQVGDGPSRSLDGPATSAGMVQFGAEASRTIVADAVKAAVFSFRWTPEGAGERLLVFRPAQTVQALKGVSEACGIPL